MFIDKLEKLQHQLIENNLDAFVIIPGSNFENLTGGDFHLMERLFLEVYYSSTALISFNFLQKSKLKK